jgi:hypothetical protein
MDLKNPVTLLLPLLGIALILAAVWLSGGLRQARLDRDLVRRRLAEDLPEFVPAEIAIAADARSAIAGEAAGRRAALVFAAGDKVVVRPLGAGELRRVAREGERLVIDTVDFTHPRFALDLPGEAERWAARLTP